MEKPAWKSSKFAPNAMAVYASVAAKPDKAPTTASPASVVQFTSTPAGRPSLASTGSRIRAVNSPSPSRAWAGTFFKPTTGLVASTARTRVAIKTNASTEPIGIATTVGGTSVGERGQRVEGADHVADQRGRHPRSEDRERARDYENLGYEGQRLLVDLGHGLEHAHQHADDQAADQQRAANLERDHERVLGGINRELLGHEKEVTSERTIRCQPSAITNSSSLNGSEMLVGGSIIMPIDISTLETTMSITRKGTMIRKPIWNAVFSSLIMKAGTRA